MYLSNINMPIDTVNNVSSSSKYSELFLIALVVISCADFEHRTRSATSANDRAIINERQFFF